MAYVLLALALVAIGGSVADEGVTPVEGSVVPCISPCKVSLLRYEYLVTNKGHQLTSCLVFVAASRLGVSG